LEFKLIQVETVVERAVRRGQKTGAAMRNVLRVFVVIGEILLRMTFAS
jgi:hypothetical protein